MPERPLRPMAQDATTVRPNGRPTRPASELGAALMRLVTSEWAPEQGAAQGDGAVPRALQAAAVKLARACEEVQGALRIPDAVMEHGRALMKMAGDPLTWLDGPAKAMSGPIRAAAVRKGSKVFEGADHVLAREAGEQAGESLGDMILWEPGYLDETSDFLTEEQAIQRAREMGQARKSNGRGLNSWNVKYRQ